METVKFKHFPEEEIGIYKYEDLKDFIIIEN